MALAPVCPHCRAAMLPRYYEGYYDSFFFWACDCEVIPDATVAAGAYSCATEGELYADYVREMES